MKRSRNSIPNTEPITTYIRNVKHFVQLFNELFICAAPSFHSVFTVGQPSCPFLSFPCCWVCLPSQPRYRHVRHVFIRLLTHTVGGLASTIWSNVDLYTYTSTSVSSPMAHIAIARLGLEHTAIRDPIYHRPGLACTPLQYICIAWDTKLPLPAGAVFVSICCGWPQQLLSRMQLCKPDGSVDNQVTLVLPPYVDFALLPWISLHA